MPRRGTAEATRRLWRVAWCAAYVACSTGEGTGVTPPPPPPDGPATLSGHVQPILTSNCAFSACHAGASPQQGMNLSEGRAHANTVNVESRQLPRLLRVEPGNPDSSYLVLKIEGNAGAVGGIGTRMPLGGRLTGQQIDTIREWVALGAANN